jgi:hypothetical protein
MLKLLTTIAALGVLSTTTTQIALAQTTQGEPGGVDLPADRALPRVPSSSPQPFDRVDSARPPSQSSESAATEAGPTSLYALSAKVVPGQSWASAVGGYDSAAQAYRTRASTETALTSYLAFRVDFEHGPSTSTTDRVSFGLRLQVLNQTTHGLDLGAGLFYQPNDFRREGNIVAALMLQRRLNTVVLLANVLLGSDPEGDDQEVDGRIGTLVRVSRLFHLGLDSRFRSVLSSDAKRLGTSGTDWEIALLPNAVLQLSFLSVIAEAGFSALHTTDLVGEPTQHKNLRTGALVMSGVAAAF